MKNQTELIPNKVEASYRGTESPMPEDEEKVISEFAQWLAELRDFRLTEKAGRLLTRSHNILH